MTLAPHATSSNPSTASVRESNVAWRKAVHAHKVVVLSNYRKSRQLNKEASLSALAQLWSRRKKDSIIVIVKICKEKERSKGKER